MKKDYAMKNKHNFMWVGAFAFVLSLLLPACKTEEVDTSKVEKLEAQMKELTINGAMASPDQMKQVARELGAAYEEVAGKLPEDDARVSAFLYHAAENYELLPDGLDKAISLYDRVQKNYPASEEAALALFNQGFIYNNNLLDTARARRVYTEFIQRFPAHELADDADFEIKTLGLSPDSLLKDPIDKEE
ncbi:MAG: hypothetical protein EAZ89_09600 [Bacteroidetes bacterium]|jgi:TolA-binding protein|nr:MAG: hypothetical protein EAZ89_09600 [Bacteroidota bacterium]